jgi:hypothetical protein
MTCHTTAPIVLRLVVFTATTLLLWSSSAGTQAVMADGQSLPAGTYQVQLSGESPAAAVGQTPDAETWVEFVQGNKVVGREIASVISAVQVASRATGAAPRPNRSRVDTLQGGEYVRVWINKGNVNYLINLVKR